MFVETVPRGQGEGKAGISNKAKRRLRLVSRPSDLNNSSNGHDQDDRHDVMCFRFAGSQGGLSLRSETSHDAGTKEHLPRVASRLSL